MKLIRTSDLREVNDQYLREEITFSRAAELLNEIANKRLSEIMDSKMQELVGHLMDTRNMFVYKKNDWTTKQMSDTFMINFFGIQPPIK